MGLIWACSKPSENEGLPLGLIYDIIALAFTLYRLRKEVTGMVIVVFSFVASAVLSAIIGYFVTLWLDKWFKR